MPERGLQTRLDLATPAMREHDAEHATEKPAREHEEHSPHGWLLGGRARERR